MTDTPEWLDHDEDGNALITLAKPLDIDGTKVAVLTMREPSVEDQLASESAKGTDAAKEIAMMSNLCDQAPTDIKRLKLRDYKRLQVALTGFID